MTLAELGHQIANAKHHPERIKAFGWFLHTHGGADRFSAKDITRCYDETHTPQPGNMARFLSSLAETAKPQLLKDPRGYRLSAAVRSEYDARFGKNTAVIVVEKMLTDLPGKIADEGERLFLEETLVCYRNGAWRAAIVMAWNLAYDHLLRWVLADPKRLADFNGRIAKRNPKKAGITIVAREDFKDLKEDEVVDILSGVTGFDDGVKRVLKEKLGRRNTFAHPSTLKVERAQVDDVVTDLVNNVVLRFKL